MLVSVIIPTYNRPEFTKEAIESVKGQTFQDFELVVVEDHEPCQGPAAVRNAGARKAKGKYIAFLDSDDLWDRRKLEKQLDHLSKNPEFKICYTNEKWVRCGEHLNQMKKHQKFQGWIFDKCLPLCIISCSSILMEKEVFRDLGGFDESLPVCEDYDLWLRMSLRYPIAFLDEKLIIKRGGHPDQLSRKYWGMDRFRIRALEKLLRTKLDPQQKKMVSDELAKKYQVLLSGSWKRGRYLQWLNYKLKSIISLR
jgi:glycosyltransferase involved in cell wall biosynthesis